MKMKWWKRAAVAIMAVTILFAAGVLVNKPAKSSPVPMHFDLYAPQKVIYHVSTGGGWFGRQHRHLIAVTNNHLNAVGEGFLDLQIILQGDGVDILMAANRDAKLAASISRLRKQGVRFLVCNNTLVMRRINYKTDLLNVSRADIVSAGVAELARLQKNGYVYLMM